MKKLNWQYAFGEILIVILGISIAFSMNKCAEDKQNKSQKLQYLTNIINDIETDKQSLETNIVALDNKIKTTSEILPVLNTNSPNKRQIIGKIFSVASISNFSPKDITYQTLINSGDLKLIDDFNIKTAIEGHYSFYDDMLKAYERQENIHKQYLGNYLIEHADYDAMQKGGFGFENEKLLKNIIQSMQGSFQLKLEASKQGVKSCDSLLTILHKAL